MPTPWSTPAAGPSSRRMIWAVIRAVAVRIAARSNFWFFEKGSPMKKRDKKLHLSRETVLQLDSGDLSQARGGIQTSCIEPNCCGNQTIDTYQQYETAK